MSSDVVAVVLAAGASRRMGTPKMVLPWGSRTVIGQVVSVLEEAGLDEILVVTGGAEPEVRQALHLHRVHLVKNDGFMAGDMLSSVQTGLTAALDGSAQAALIVLGDQPQIQAEVVKALLLRWQTARLSDHHSQYPDAARASNVAGTQPVAGGFGFTIDQELA